MYLSRLRDELGLGGRKRRRSTRSASVYLCIWLANRRQVGQHTGRTISLRPPGGEDGGVGCYFVLLSGCGMRIVRGNPECYTLISNYSQSSLVILDAQVHYHTLMYPVDKCRHLPTRTLP